MRLRLGDLLANASAPAYRGCSPDTEVYGLEVDSRRVTPGIAFLATYGATHDTHNFIPAAIVAGARVIIAERARLPGPLPDHPIVLLPDTQAAYPRLAANAYGRPHEALRLTGLTGTNGKTTSTFLLATILQAAGRPHTRLGTTDNWVVDRHEPAHFTTPFPLELQGLLARTRDRGGRDVIMEVSSHALAQGRVRALPFQCVGLTSFSQDHLDFHATMDEYLAAKCLLASDYLTRDGLAVAAACGAASRRFLAAAKAAGADAWSVSTQEPKSSAGARAELQVVRLLDPKTLALDERDPAGAPPVSTAAEITTPHGAGLLRSPLFGAFNLDNALVALGLSLGLGLSLERALAGLRMAEGAPGRLERVSVTGVIGPTVIVDYAHTPDAVARALQALRPTCRARLWIVLGCGGDRDPSKRPLMGQLAAAHADHLVATSDNPRTEDPGEILDQMIRGVSPDHQRRLIRAPDRRAAIALAVTSAAVDDVVLIAGKGHEDYQVIGTEKRPFDDRDEAAAALRLRVASP